MLALDTALRAPAWLASLVLAEPPLHRWACTTQDGKRQFGEFIDRTWRPAAAAFGLGQPRRAMQLLTNGMWGRAVFESWPSGHIDGVTRNASAMHALAAAQDPFPEFDRGAVAGLTMPTLLLQGMHTSALHRLVMHELAQVMPSARLVEIPFAGHGVPNENPSGFNAAIISFLEPLEAPRGRSR